VALLHLQYRAYLKMATTAVTSPNLKSSSEAIESATRYLEQKLKLQNEIFEYATNSRQIAASQAALGDLYFE
jgi:hypothetical protein